MNPKTRTYHSWQAMKARCSNPRATGFIHYGGRGITICDRWWVFENFLADMGERPEGRTLDRIDNDGNYEPGNCRWATVKEQNFNKRPPTPEAIATRSASKRATHASRPVPTKICPQCHTEFPSRLARRTFCSYSCSSRNRIAQMKANGVVMKGFAPRERENEAFMSGQPPKR